MYIGHFAAAIGVTSIRPKRGVLTYMALSTRLPDLLMLGVGSFSSRWSYHADAGLLLCIGVVVVIGLIFRSDPRTIGLALACLLAHLLLDLPYVARDESNPYSHPWIDFALEASLVLAASALFAWRTRPSRKRLGLFLGVVAVLLALQGAWDMNASSFPV